MKRYGILIVMLAVLLGALGCAPGEKQSGGAADTNTRTVTDSRGEAVEVPAEIGRVVTVSDGLVEGVMTRFGLQDRIVGIGSEALQKDWNYTFEATDGGSYSFEKGMNPVAYLNPGFKDLPLIAGDTGINYESLAGLEPDVVIIRLGSCNLWTDDEKVRLTVKTLESLGIPLVVLYGTHFHEKPSVSTIGGEIKILGELFGKQAEAAALAAYLEDQVNFIRERTKDIPDGGKPGVLVFGPSPSARKKGGAGQVFGLDTIESYFIEDVANARNAYQTDGYFRIVSAEHLLAMDPDAIVLCTAAGYHPPRELYEAPYYRNLAGLKAVKNRRVSALPWTPWNCAKRLEYPIDAMVIAKAAYPDKFADVDLGDWLLDFYAGVYGVDAETAAALRSAQWLDWTAE